MSAAAIPEFAFELAAVSDTGTERDHNEDAAGCLVESPTCGILAVADGVSGFSGGETASKTALDTLLAAFREQPASVAPAKRLYRASQQANIEVHDLAMVVPELRGMATTLTALVVDRGDISAAHVGDSRLYRVRGAEVTQLTKDHTVAAEKVRRGTLSAAKARQHPDRGTLTKSLGRELIAQIDQISFRAEQGDALIVCSDGLYNVLDDAELAHLIAGLSAEAACRRLIDEANERGTIDNASVAVARLTGPIPAPDGGLGAKIKRFFGA
jgi:protein phosphatase